MDFPKPQNRALLCPVCNQLVEVHQEGWAYDHTIDETMSGDLCEGSGKQITPSYLMVPEPSRPDATVQLPSTTPKRPDSVTDTQTGDDPDRDDFSGFEFRISVIYCEGYRHNNWSQTFIHPAPAQQLFDLLNSQVGVNGVIVDVVYDARSVGDWVVKRNSSYKKGG